jgi:hypothetical protein
MRPTSTFAVLAAVSLALVTTGCWHKCPTGPCPTLWVDEHDATADDGEIWWEWEGQHRTFPLNPESSYGTGPAPACFAHLSAGLEFGLSAEVTEPSAPMSLGLGCSGDSFDRFDLSVAAGDLRPLGIDSYTAGSVRGSYGDRCLAELTCDLYHGQCDFELPPDLVQIVIEEATGGPAAYPQAVTADFMRTFRVDVVMPEAVLGLPRNSDLRGAAPRPSCEDTIRIGGSIRFTLNASDYHANPNAGCPCPM